MTAFVTTFYSFKGGVGRTTLLVNVAHTLAAQGERVLIWDLDLEAPGVHQFPGLEPPDQIWESGFLEWLGRQQPPFEAHQSDPWPAQDEIEQVAARVYRAIRQKGEILVLPAHGTFANLGRAYAAIDWHSLFVESPQRGLELFERVRDELIAQYEPTFLFIDSRTGISDLGGILTAYLPDCTVLVGNYSAQSTNGLRATYLGLDEFATERAQKDSYRKRRLERLLVASPVPSSPAERARGRKRWLDGFPGIAPQTLIEVPLVENLLYAEDVLVRSAPQSDAAKAYREVAKSLVELRRARPVTVDGSLVAASAEKSLPQLFQWLGYEVVPEGKHGDSGVDLVARDRAPLGGGTYAVRYLKGSARVNSTFRHAIEQLRSMRGTRALLCVDDARADAVSAAEAAGISMFTIDELEDRLLDRTAYAAFLRRRFESSELARSYVPLQLDVAGRSVDALTHALAWSTGRGKRLMLLQGAPGTGKSSFLRRLAYELANRFVADPSSPLPLMLNLSGTSGSLDDLLQQHLRDSIGWYGNPEAVRHLLREGKLLLLVDSLDATAVATGAAAEEQLRILAQPALEGAGSDAGNRILIATRPGAHLDPAIAPLSEVVELGAWSKKEMVAFLEYKLGGLEARRVHEVVDESSTLSNLASRPLMLQLLASGALESLETERATTAHLYARYVQSWIDREAARNPREVHRVLEQLAVEQSARASSVVSHATIAAVTELDAQLRTASFLVRTDTGYGFAHRGFVDYFVACALVSRAEQGQTELANLLGTVRLTSECVELFVELVRDKPAVRAAIEGFTAAPLVASVSENALRLASALERGTA